MDFSETLDKSRKHLPDDTPPAKKIEGKDRFQCGDCKRTYRYFQMENRRALEIYWVLYANSTQQIAGIKEGDQTLCSKCREKR